MIKILEIISHSAGAVSFYRSRLPLVQLHRTRVDINVFIQENSSYKYSWDFFIQFDIIFTKSFYRQVDLDFLRRAKKFGVKIIIDIDDFIFDIPGYVKGAEEFNSAKTQSIIKECLWIADEVWTSTDTLARELFLKTERRCTVIRNAYEPLFFNRTPIFNKGKDILYRGSYVHMADVDNHREDLVEVVNKNDCIITFMGQYPLFYKEFKYTAYKSFMEVDQYIDTLPTIGASINLVLLDTSKTYSMCHSNNGWIEGTYAGAVTLAPKVEEWIRPGIINYTDDFKEKLNAMIKGEYDLESLHQQSWHYIEENCMLEKANELRYNSINRLLNRQS